MLLDWTCTPTTSEFRWWLKVDDIYNQLYQNRYFLKTRRRILKKRGGHGHKQPLGPKLGTGFLLSLGLLIVIWSPLIILAALASSTTNNLPLSSRVEVSLGVSTPPIYQARTNIDETLTVSQYSQLQRLSSQEFLDQFPRSSTALAVFIEASTSLWAPSPAALDTLVGRLNSTTETIEMTFSYSFQRTSRPASTQEAEGRTTLSLSPGDPSRVGLFNIITAGGGSVQINATFPAFVVLDSGESVQTEGLPRSLQTKSTIELTLTQAGSAFFWSLEQVSPNLVRYLQAEMGSSFYFVATCLSSLPALISVLFQCWSAVSEFFLHLMPQTYFTSTLLSQENVAREGLQLVTLNKEVAVGLLQVLQGFGIAGLYVSFVLVVGRLIRTLMKGISMRIIYEDMPSVQTLVNLIHAIYVARESGEMALEEDLTLLLLQLYRSPEALITWTGSLLHDENTTFYDVNDPEGDIK